MSNQLDSDIELGTIQLSNALDAQHRGTTREALYTAIDFCKAWPVAKAVLQIIADAVPVVGRIVVGVIIKIGDRVYTSKGCTPPLGNS
jgi:hypothetical protein